MVKRMAELYPAAVEEIVASTYLTMVGIGRAQLGDLLAEGLSEPDARVAVRVLCSRGLIEEIESDHWEVRPPEPALLRYADAMEQRARESRANAGSLGALWRRATQQGTDLFSEGLRLLVSVPEIVRSTHVLVEQSQECLWWVLDPSVASQQLLRMALEDPRRVATRAGVQVSMVVDRALLDIPGVLNELERRVSDGYQVRLISRLAFTAVVSDDTAALVDLSGHDPGGDGSFEVRRPNPINVVRTWSKVLYDIAAPLAPALTSATEPPTGAGALDERDRRILSLLATGLSDQIIARYCGVSTRTVERRVRYLMDRLGATTRFQAGAHAVRRGWL